MWPASPRGGTPSCGEATLAGEHIEIDQRVTNVYRREAGGWKIVHHHTDLSPAMLELLARLQQAA